MVDHREVVLRGVFQDPAHDLARRNRHAVIAQSDGSGLAQQREVGQLLPLLAKRRGGDRPDPSAAGGGRLLEHEPGHRRLVIDRIGVGHAGDGTEATCGCRACARGNRLRLLAPGFAEVHVDIDEARGDEQVCGFDLLGVSRHQISTDLGDQTTGQAHVQPLFIELRCGVD